MMKKIIPLLLFVEILSIKTIKTQVYVFSYFNSPYNDITGGTNMLSGYNDSLSASFKMKIGDSIAYKLQITKTGNITTERYSVLSKWFYPFECETSSGQYTYLEEGAAGNRILKLQFKDVKFSHDWNTTSFMNFQIWIYESNYSIEVHYGTSSILDAFNCYYPGNGGPSVGFANLRLNGNALSPILSATNSYLTGTPPADMVYRFERDNPVGIKEQLILSKAPVIYPMPVTDELFIQPFPSTNSKIEIMDASGTIILTKKLSTNKNGISVSDLKAGLYFIKIGNNEIQKFIKE